MSRRPEQRDLRFTSIGGTDAYSLPRPVGCGEVDGAGLIPYMFSSGPRVTLPHPVRGAASPFGAERCGSGTKCQSVVEHGFFQNS